MQANNRTGLCYTDAGKQNGLSHGVQLGIFSHGEIFSQGATTHDVVLTKAVLPLRSLQPPQGGSSLFPPISPISFLLAFKNKYLAQHGGSY